jgi:thiol-disulfide isomerase/thioredoxin
MKHLAIAVVLGVASIGGVAFMLFGEREAAAPYGLPPPSAVPASAVADLYSLSLPDLDGRIQTLAQWRGQVLIVNYWASWCAPCRKEMPILSGLQTRMAGRGVQVVGIAADNAEKAGEYALATPVSYPLLVGGPDAIRLTRAFGNIPQAVPFTLVIDRTGQVRAAVLGVTHEEALERLVATLI